MRSIKYTNSKGDSIVIGENYIPTETYDDVFFKLDYTNLPAYPDGTADYIKNGFVAGDVAAWTAENGSIALSGNDLLLTATDANAGFYKSLSIAANHTMRVYLKCGGAYGTRTLSLYNGSDEATKTFTASTSYQYIDIISTYTYSTTTIRITDSANTETYSFALVYIGADVFNSVIPDTSSNKANYTPYGVLHNTYLFLDGSNDYLKSSAVVAAIPDYCHFHIEKPSGYSGSGSQTLFNYRTTSTTDGFITAYRSTLDLIIGYCTGDSSATITFTDYFSGYSATKIVINIAIDWTNYTVKAFRNGAQFGTTQNLTTPVKPLAGAYCYIGAYQGASNFDAGYIDNIVFFSAEKTAAMVNCIYENNTIPFLSTGETTYGIIESLDGIDQPFANVQTTSAPNQDGTTYIDTLLSDREIVITGSITAPTNLDTIYAQRKIILDVLNPKYGNGNLSFYYGRDTIYQRELQNVNVVSVKFANRVFPEPFQKFQITLDAHNPYFYEPEYDTKAYCILSGGSATIHIDGENDVYPSYRIYASSTNPTITNSATGESFAMTYALSSGYIDVTTDFGGKTVIKNDNTNLIGDVDLGSEFVNLIVGDNVITFSGGGYVIVYYRNRYIGV